MINRMALCLCSVAVQDQPLGVSPRFPLTPMYLGSAGALPGPWANWQSAKLWRVRLRSGESATNRIAAKLRGKPLAA